ncbi:MAG: hypothetical protein ACK47B_21815 [Armatimonadota bacterium]
MPLTDEQAQVIRDAISARLTAQWSYILSCQETYFAAHGRYAQGLRTHSEIPADGQELAPDLGMERPTDQAECWIDLAMLPGSMLSAMEIDVYEGPQGHGFVVRLLVVLNGQLWVLERQHGPEAGRDRDWHGPSGSTEPEE